MSLKNGHAKAKTPAHSAGAIRSRLFRDRKRRGAVIVTAEIQAAMIEALISCGWLHSLERDNRVAVTAAIGAIVHQALAAEMAPAKPDKLFVPVDLRALEDAWIWAKPGSQPSPENAARALSAVAKCSALVNFTPQEFGERLKVLAGLN